MSYRNLEIWKLARKNSIDIHKMSLTQLPLFEMFEEGRQIRRSCKSVRSNIVEGYGRKRYTGDYLKFLTYSLASNDETIDHLETLFETESLKDEILYKQIWENVNQLGKMLNNFIKTIEKSLLQKK